MKVRAVANGNVMDLPADHPLIAAGIYEPVDDEPAPRPAAQPATPTQPVETRTTAVAPLTTADVPLQPEAPPRRRGRPPKPR